MKNKKIPMRSCVVTREKCEKKDLIRIVRTPDAEVKIYLTASSRTRALRRWKLRKDIPEVSAMKALNNIFNYKFYHKGDNKECHSRWRDT